MPKNSLKAGSSQSKTKTTAVSSALDPLEDRTLRVLHGSTVPDGFLLTQKDAGLPQAVQAKLREIEQKAFRKARRLRELEDELEIELAAERNREAARDKIVRHLKGQKS